MLKTLENSKQRWGGYSEVIDYWLNLRQDLLVNYSKVAGLSNTDKRCLPTEEELTEFCGSLIDYVSAGHFRIYDKVMSHWKGNGVKASTESDILFFKIAETTTPLVDFNDKYDNFHITEDNFSHFDEDISRVGEIMELRFEYEDQLIQLIAESVKN